jgi:hypothetical protein
MTELKSGLERFTEDGKKAEKFLTLAKKYTNFDELTTPMLNEFVEKIMVHEAERINWRRSQKVEIFLSFIGKFDVPGKRESDPEPFDPVEHQRAIWRNYYYRYSEKICIERAARAAEKKAAKLASMPVKTPAEIEAEAEARRQKKLKYQRDYQREWQRRRREEAAAKLTPLPVKTPAEIEAEKEARREKKRKYEREYRREWKRRRKEKAAENALAKVCSSN